MLWLLALGAWIPLSYFAFAVLNSSRSGIYVRAVVPAAGKITIYLNKAVSSSTYVSWLVLG